MKMNVKNFGKMRLISEFSISKLCYTELFKKILEEFFVKFYLRRPY